ncbi:MAG: DUF3189 family protein [Bacillota bacterium]|uniref:DUF3189 family protein n=1 Tax=Thermanaerosceptrum fracticalcis TaxID=1712410 RepID=UPI0005578960|nr:DUF3189 family protein [Thermanaerosceptrum fracticalcis]
MKIVYLDQLGCHASVLAASWYAGFYDETMHSRDILKLPHFAAHTDFRVGKLYYVGKDTRGTELFTLGVGSEGKIISIAALDLFKLLEAKEQVLVIDVSPCNHFFIRLCWYLQMIKPLKYMMSLCSAYFLKRELPKIKKLVKIKLDEIAQAKFSLYNRYIV